MTKLHQTEKQPQRGVISSQGCSVAKPLVRNAHLGCVLAAEMVEEASLFRQNPVLFGFAFSFTKEVEGSYGEEYGIFARILMWLAVFSFVTFLL